MTWAVAPAFISTSHAIADLSLCQVRLQDDARYPWLILLPRVPYVIELTDLSAADRSRLMEEIVLVSMAVRRLGEYLPADTLIRPGHNYGITPVSTLAEQRDGNPFLHFDDCPGFVEYRMHLHDREEPYRAEPRRV